MTANYPRIWAVFCFVTGEVEYSNTRYTAAQGFINSIPESIRSNFVVLRYDVNKFYTTQERNTENEPQR